MSSRWQTWLWMTAAGVLLSGAARAEDVVLADGVYGRFDGDLDLSLAAGPALTREGMSAALLARVLFLETAGFYLAYDDRLDNASSGPHRSLGLGVALRPL